MEPSFWHSKWEAGQIGFHLHEVNPFLVRHWPALGLAPDSRVLVPLCGKSLDLAWLARHHRVTGVELSPIACQAFFEREGLDGGPRPAGPYTAWEAGSLTLLNGDVFHLDTSEPWDAAFDRAAVVALPPAMRWDYARLLERALRPGAPVLAVTMTWPEGERGGPPFSVPETELRALYPGWTITELESVDRPEEAAAWGLSSMREHVWLLRRPH